MRQKLIFLFMFISISACLKEEELKPDGDNALIVVVNNFTYPVEVFLGKRPTSENETQGIRFFVDQRSNYRVLWNVTAVDKIDIWTYVQSAYGNCGLPECSREEETACRRNCLEGDCCISTFCCSLEMLFSELEPNTTYRYIIGEAELKIDSL